MEDLKLLKLTIRGLNYRYNALKKIISFTGSAKNEKDLLDDVLGMINELVGFEAGLITSKNEAGDMILKVFRADIPFTKEAELKKKLEGRADSEFIKAFDEFEGSQRDILVLEKPEIILSYHKMIKNMLINIADTVLVPIRSNGRYIGIIELFNKRGGGLGKDKKEALISIGNHLGVSIEIFTQMDSLKSQAVALKELATITEAVSSPHQVDEVLEAIMNNSTKYFKAVSCTIFLNDKEGKPEFAAVRGKKASELKGKKLNKGEGVVGWVIENGKPVLIEDVSGDSRFSGRIDSITKMESGSIICTPLKVANDVIGAVEVIREKEKEPFKKEEMNLLSILSSHASIAIDKARLYNQKYRWFKSSVELLSRTVDTKDRLFHSHSKLVKKYLNPLARALELSHDDMELLDLAASIQDIGKITIPEKILTKEGKLSEQEWEEIRKHPLVSVNILSVMEDFGDIIPIIKHVRERYDGTGYPDTLCGEKIPRLARILAVADAYAAMIGKRPYRKSYTEEEAIKILKEQKARQFDPVIVDSFIKCLKKTVV
ncbi:HD domain-containing phosphohydrolase [Elusimicrobiota bacterium]